MLASYYAILPASFKHILFQHVTYFCAFSTYQYDKKCNICISVRCILNPNCSIFSTSFLVGSSCWLYLGLNKTIKKHRQIPTSQPASRFRVLCPELASWLSQVRAMHSFLLNFNDQVWNWRLEYVLLISLFWWLQGIVLRRSVLSFSTFVVGFAFLSVGHLLFCLCSQMA